jgi:hypothetical protein
MKRLILVLVLLGIAGLMGVSWHDVLDCDHSV